MSTTGHDLPAVADAEIREIADRVYCYLQPDGTWWINNTGFVVGSDSVVSIDACSTERRTRAYLDRIREVTSAPVRTLINTHHHGDHTYGNYLFDGAVVVAHERCRTEMLDFGLPPEGVWQHVEWGALQIRPPEITYDTGITVWSDENRMTVRHVGTPAHTTNDSIVLLPEARVAFVGDLLFNGGTPFVLMGSVAGAIDVLETKVRSLPADILVPGHGEPCGLDLVDDVLAYLRFVEDAAGNGHAAGLTPLETARELDLGRFAELTDAERIVGNLHRAYAELGDDAELGTGIDIRAALQDMVTFNGGHPLTCHA